MRKYLAYLLAFLMILNMAALLGACKDKDSVDNSDAEATEAAVDAEEQEPEADEESEDVENIVKIIEPDSEEEIGKDIPMQIESVTLYKDGSIKIVPTDDLKKNELGDSEADSIMPFAESGEVKDIYLCRIGNGGYRTIVALMEDGTVSAVNTRALIEDHIVAVMDNLGGRDSFTGIEQDEGEEGFSIIGKTEEGDDVVLDPVILSEDEEPQPAEQAE